MFQLVLQLDRIDMAQKCEVALVLVGSRLNTVLQRINAAPIQHQCNTHQHGKPFWSRFCSLLALTAYTSAREEITALIYVVAHQWCLAPVVVAIHACTAVYAARARSCNFQTNCKGCDACNSLAVTQACMPQHACCIPA